MKKGVMMLIVAMLGLSALIRSGHGMGAVLALEAAEDSGASACALEDGAAALLEALKAREARLEVHEAQLADRMQALALAEARMKETERALLAAEAALAETLALSDGAAEADLARLTAVYESMKPKEAAALFQEMAPDFAAGFLARMRPEAAAALMAGLPPQTAYGFSVLLAGRHARVPKE